MIANNINKKNNLLSPKLKKNKKKIMAYVNGKQGPE
jgi:hypothetical protein